MRHTNHSILILHCGLLLLLVNCVRTTANYDYRLGNSITDFDEKYSLWPSFHNGVNLMRMRKREAQGQEGVQKVANQDPVIKAEGGIIGDVSGLTQSAVQPTVKTPVLVPVPGDAKEDKKDDKPDLSKVAVKVNDAPVVSPDIHNVTNHNATVAGKTNTQLDSEVLKRGVIVFGGFLLLAAAYFIFYRRKSNKNDTNNVHNTIDANQFRYGVLQSEDRRDNLELSRIPLTMESDDDEDEDLEIFDLEQKKKSLSYVNLQTNDEDVVFNSSTENSRGNDKDNLLLDIEDPATDTLINWSNNDDAFRTVQQHSSRLPFDV